MKLSQYENQNGKIFKHKSVMDDSENDEYSSEQLGFFANYHQIANYTVPIDGPFREPSFYRGVINMLMNASEQDTVAFMINSDGGQLSSLLSLLEGINMTKANTVALVVGSASSAASMFALHCNEVYVGDNATFLCHNISYGTGGKGSDVLAHVQHTTSSASKLLRKTYKNFLSEIEITDMINGKEIYMESDEIVERLQQREELFQAEQEAGVKPKRKAPAKSK
jgi:ATP-dependent protease ClpP protease subunit